MTGKDPSAVPEPGPATGLLLSRLQGAIAPHQTMLVAFSGGVDSTLVMKVAHDALGERAAALMAVSESLPAAEREQAIELARSMGVTLHLAHSHELSDPRYRANPGNRCYYCKSELFALLEEEAKRIGFGTLAYGANLDDLGDHRPGMAAAGEHGVVAPLIEAGFRKADIRALARHLGLPNWDKPARACLSSRIPHGVEVTPDKLAAVERAEEGLLALGFREVRVRWHGEIARVELGEGEMARLSDATLRKRLSEAVKAAGFRFATLDLDGYRQGSLNPPLLAITSSPSATSPPGDPAERNGRQQGLGALDFRKQSR